MTAMNLGATCGCCGESVSPLYIIEAIAICLDCREVYFDGIGHRWDQIKAVSVARKEFRRSQARNTSND